MRLFLSLIPVVVKSNSGATKDSSDCRWTRFVWIETVDRSAARTTFTILGPTFVINFHIFSISFLFHISLYLFLQFYSFINFHECNTEC